MKIRYWDVIPGKCDGAFERPIDFDPTEHTTAESAARAFHAALVKLCREAGPDDTWYGQDPVGNLFLWSPGERTDMTNDPTAWGICWEGGPDQWAHMTDVRGTETYVACPADWSFVMLFYPPIAVTV